VSLIVVRGHHEVLDEGDLFKVKRIEVLSGKRPVIKALETG
jgi:hypothetical protein